MSYRLNSKIRSVRIVQHDVSCMHLTMQHHVIVTGCMCIGTSMSPNEPLWNLIRFGSDLSAVSSTNVKGLYNYECVSLV